MSSVPKFEGQGTVITDPITAGGIRLPISTQVPLVGGAIGLAMAEKRIKREAEVLTLPRHYVDGIMEKKRSNFARRFRHENARMRLVAHQYRERSDVILMRVSDKNRVDCLALDRLPIWQRILADTFGMHPAIKNQPSTLRLEIVRVRTDFSLSGQVDELHAAGLSFSSAIRNPNLILRSEYE